MSGKGFTGHTTFTVEAIDSPRCSKLNRAADPTSKIGVFEWASKTACPAFLGVSGSADVDFEIYRDLDRLSRKQDEIMTYLYHALERRGLCRDGYPFYWEVLKERPAKRPRSNTWFFGSRSFSG